MVATAPAKPADCATIPVGLAVIGSKVCNEGIIACINTAACWLGGWVASILGIATL